MNRSKKIGAIAIVGALLITYGIVAASASTSGNSVATPLTLTPAPSSPSTNSPTVPLIPPSGALGSNQTPLTSGDDSAVESDDDSVTSAGVASSDDDGDDDSVTTAGVTSSDYEGDDDSVTTAGVTSSDVDGDDDSFGVGSGSNSIVLSNTTSAPSSQTPSSTDEDD